MKYELYTPHEAAVALGYINPKLKFANKDENAEAELIAKEFLDGVMKLSPDELKLLAKYKGVTVDELCELDNQFANYRDPVKAAKMEIARKLLDEGCAPELVKRVCEVEMI